MNEDYYFLGKISTSSEDGKLKIEEIKPLTLVDVEFYNGQKDLIANFNSDFMLMEYVERNYNSYKSYLFKKIEDVGREVGILNNYPLK
ncbi:hypothetical protein BS639_22855, partial [Rouxiella silvae]